MNDFFNLQMKLEESVCKKNLSHKFGLETVPFSRGLNHSQRLFRESHLPLSPGALMAESQKGQTEEFLQRNFPLPQIRDNLYTWNLPSNTEAF